MVLQGQSYQVSVINENLIPIETIAANLEARGTTYKYQFVYSEFFQSQTDPYRFIVKLPRLFVTSSSEYDSVLVVPGNGSLAMINQADSTYCGLEFNSMIHSKVKILYENLSYLITGESAVFQFEDHVINEENKEFVIIAQVHIIDSKFSYSYKIVPEERNSEIIPVPYSNTCVGFVEKKFYDDIFSEILFLDGNKSNFNNVTSQPDYNGGDSTLKYFSFNLDNTTIVFSPSLFAETSGSGGSVVSSAIENTTVYCELNEVLANINDIIEVEYTSLTTGITKHVNVNDFDKDFIRSLPSDLFAIKVLTKSKKLCLIKYLSK